VRKKHFRRAGDSALLGRHRIGAELEATRLDLDEGQHAAAPRDNVDFTHRNTPIARQDAPAAEPKTHHAGALAAPAETFRAPSVWPR